MSQPKSKTQQVADRPVCTSGRTLAADGEPSNGGRRALRCAPELGRRPGSRNAVLRGISATAVLLVGGCLGGPQKELPGRQLWQGSEHKHAQILLVNGGPAADRIAESARQLAQGGLEQAATTLRELLATRPDHLEAWVLSARLATAQGDADEARRCWQRVDRVVAVKGKLEPFVEPADLLAAARYYLAGGATRRAEIFLQSLWLRFPRSEASARAYLAAAEAAVRSRDWERARGRCVDLARIGGDRSAEIQRCQALMRRAEQLAALGPEPSPGAARWLWEAPLPQGNTLRAGWMSPTGEAFLVGDRGALVHRRRRGGALRVIETPTRWGINGIAGARRDALYAVGGGGQVLRFDGAAWRVLRPPRAAAATLRAVCVGRAGGVVAVGDGGLVLRIAKDGDYRQEKPVTAHLRGVWCGGVGEVLAVGDEGMLLRAQGSGLEQLKSDTYERLRGVAVTSRGEILAVGARRTLVRLRGGVAKEHVVGSGGYTDLWARSRAAVWISGSGGRVFRARRAAAEPWRLERTSTSLRLEAIVGTSPADLIAVGEGGVVVARRGRRWRQLAGGRRDDLVGVSIDRRAGAVALSASGRLWRRRGRRWSSSKLSIAGSYRAAWFGSRAGLAVGENGLFVSLKGAAATRIAVNASEQLNAVTRASVGDLAVGERGLLVRRTRTGVGIERIGDGHALHAVAEGETGVIWVVGDRGSILRGGAGHWERMSSGVLARLRAIWPLPGQGAVAVGEGGTIVRLRGARWVSERAPTGQDLVSVWGTSSGQLYAVSARGTIVHYDGEGWQVENSPAACLTAVGGDAGSGEVLAVGCYGAILRRHSG